WRFAFIGLDPPIALVPVSGADRVVVTNRAQNNPVAVVERWISAFLASVITSDVIDSVHMAVVRTVNFPFSVQTSLRRTRDGQDRAEGTCCSDQRRKEIPSRVSHFAFPSFDVSYVF